MHRVGIVSVKDKSNIFMAVQQLIKAKHKKRKLEYDQIKAKYDEVLNEAECMISVVWMQNKLTAARPASTCV